MTDLTIQHLISKEPAAPLIPASMKAGRAQAEVFSSVVGRVGRDAVDEILKSRGHLFEVFPLVWVVGAAASGKSTTLRVLHSVYPDVPVIHDRHALVDALREQRGALDHDGLPTVVDREILSLAFIRVARLAETSTNALIELGRGRSAGLANPGNASDDPMSLSFALNALPKSVLSRSLFIHLSAPLSDRIARNAQRPLTDGGENNEIPHIRCSDDTMHTVFSNVDTEALTDRDDVSFVELRNVVDKSDFMDLLNLFFGGIR